MMKRHYAPDTKFIFGNIPQIIPPHSALLAFGKLPHHSNQSEDIRNLSESGNASEAASRLSGLMRELDSLGLERIYAPPRPPEGLGLAVNDRLRKAGGST
jgi:L-threonylcarbamoyladenylate synthase